MNPTNRCSPDNVIEWVTPTVEKEGLKDYTINVAGSSEKGDGYLGDITFVEVIGKLQSDEEKVYNFVVKCGKKSKELRDVMPIRSAFENEIYFYNTILPTFISFQAEKGVRSPFRHTPKCYDTLILEDMEMLILEDVKQREFTLHNRKLAMNRDHILKVMEVYGKYHAISFAFRKEQPKEFTEMTGHLVDIFKVMRDAHKAMPKNYNLFEQIIKAAEAENEQEIVDKCHDLNKKLRSHPTDPTSPYTVILHGDCWNNNFMFKYEDKEQTRVSEVCLLDFQLSRLGSPVCDLSYFLFTCISKEDVNDFDELISFYYETLSNSLKAMGHDAAELFPFEELQRQWKTFSVFGITMLPSIIQLCLSEKDEVPDLVETAESGGDIVSIFSSSIKSEKQYRDRTIPVMKLVINKQFI